ncbi:MAG: PQQ-dependent sugar dehydrogenase [Actinomycetota bacterium]|nr:PQQ-dependent sugar dehydrogenase [Actinomycetota bacterium]
MQNKLKLISIFLICMAWFLPACSPAPAGTAAEAIIEHQPEPEMPAPGQPDSKEADVIAETQKEGPTDLKELSSLEYGFDLIDAFPSLSFNLPVDIQQPGDGSGRLFVVEKEGRIIIIDKQGQSTQIFLNITDRVNSSGSEQGLLGLAFHPDFEQNGYFWVNYTDNNGTVVSRFIAEPGTGLADPESEQVTIAFPQPYSNHNGGQIAFGPDDGYLYIAAGDGGSGGDPHNNGQSLNTLLGKILRIDIDHPSGGKNYSIPPQNPFASNQENILPEIYAYGLRNPWRFSFDPETNKLWAADVGQNKVEEINIIESGKNYGWNIMEGSQCFNPPQDCFREDLVLPVYEYEHPLGKSVTGGYVYKGQEISSLYGLYIYADFVTGYVWALSQGQDGKVENFTLAETGLNISSLGKDQDQELYFAAFDGNIYKLALP